MVKGKITGELVYRTQLTWAIGGGEGMGEFLGTLTWRSRHSGGECGIGTMST